MFSITYKKAGGVPPPQKEKIMSKPSVNERTRCTHRTSNGRRCQSPIAPKHRSLCAHHALQDLQRHDSKLVAEEILGPNGDFGCSFGIHSALGKLFAATIENRISPRTASVLAYISQLLMQNLDEAQRDVLQAVGQPAMEVMLKDVYGHIGADLKDRLDAVRGVIDGTLDIDAWEKERVAKAESGNEEQVEA
jgi:hypothetical protein